MYHFLIQMSYCILTIDSHFIAYFVDRTFNKSKIITLFRSAKCITSWILTFTRLAEIPDIDCTMHMHEILLICHFFGFMWIQVSFCAIAFQFYPVNKDQIPIYSFWLFCTHHEYIFFSILFLGSPGCTAYFPSFWRTCWEISLNQRKYRIGIEAMPSLYFPF